MVTGLKPHHLLIYKGKIFIGSYGCRNDCLAVHFICHKRRDLGVSPPEPGRYKNTACRVWLACRLRGCVDKLIRSSLTVLQQCRHVQRQIHYAFLFFQIPVMQYKGNKQLLIVFADKLIQGRKGIILSRFYFNR